MSSILESEIAEVFSMLDLLIFQLQKQEQCVCASQE